MTATQGKWTVSRHDDNNDIVVRGENEQIVANCTVDFIGGHPHGKEIQSNARLIAVAPILQSCCNMADDLLRNLLDSKIDFDDEQRIEIDEVLGEIQAATATA